MVTFSEHIRDLNCAVCGRPMTEVLEAIVVSDQSRVLPVSDQSRVLPIVTYPDGTAHLVCGGCDPADTFDQEGGE